MIKNKLKEKREKMGYSVNKAALYSGLMHRRYNELETADHQTMMNKIKYVEMQRLAQLFDTSIDELFNLAEYNDRQLFKIDYNK